MSRKKKVTEIENLFQTNFIVSFIHKPTMETGDTFYYVILDDNIRIRLKLFGTIMVIDEVTPLNMKYMAKIFSTLMETLTNQSKFTVLISILGNTSELASECVKNGALVVEDNRFITVPENYYNRMKDYYKGNTSKYGFYLLAVNDDEIETKQEDDITETTEEDFTDEVDMGPPITIGVKPILERLSDFIMTKFNIVKFPEYALNDMTISMDEDTIEFKVKTNVNDTKIYIGSFVIGEEYKYTKLVELLILLSSFLDDCPDIYIEVNTPIVEQICEFLSFERQRFKVEPQVSISSIAVYKVINSD